MTLQEVPTEILAESLLAVQDLRRKYLGEEMVTVYAGNLNADWATEACPLCRLQNTLDEEECGGGTDSAIGKSCPWLWIEGAGCVPGNYLGCGIRATFQRIDRWELAITEELATRRITQEEL